MKPAINLKPPHVRIIIALRVKEHSLNHRARVINRRKIARPNPAINLKECLTLRRGRIFLKRRLNIFPVARINISKRLLNFALFHAKRAQKRRHWQFPPAVNLHKNRTVRRRFKLQPRAATRNHLRAIITLRPNRFRIKEHPCRTNQLRHNHALCSINNKRCTVSHPRIITEVNILFLLLAGHFVLKFHQNV